MLARLAAKGDLIEIRAGHFALTRGNREFVVGRLSMHRDGYGFLIPDRPIEGVAGDIYIPANAASTGMHGDRAVVRISRIEPSGRADGEIVKILKRAHPTVVGAPPLVPFFTTCRLSERKHDVSPGIALDAIREPGYHARLGWFGRTLTLIRASGLSHFD